MGSLTKYFKRAMMLLRLISSLSGWANITFSLTISLEFLLFFFCTSLSLRINLMTEMQIQIKSRTNDTLKALKSAGFPALLFLKIIQTQITGLTILINSSTGILEFKSRSVKALTKNEIIPSGLTCFLPLTYYFSSCAL